MALFSLKIRVWIDSGLSASCGSYSSLQQKENGRVRKRLTALALPYSDVTVQVLGGLVAPSHFTWRSLACYNSRGGLQRGHENMALFFLGESVCGWIAVSLPAVEATLPSKKMENGRVRKRLTALALPYSGYGLGQDGSESFYWVAGRFRLSPLLVIFDTLRPGTYKRRRRTATCICISAKVLHLSASLMIHARELKASSC
ncbi:hypothetical protein BC832DRAFT_72413 [Gaertneriomyces semiglobifer]|nr:hypothetical protein BC832DRAFT_72413 [Gaertneriomyces semiglobifer]